MELFNQRIWLLLVCVFTFTILTIKNDKDSYKDQIYQRFLLEAPVVEKGTQSLVPDITVYGSVIMSDIRSFRLGNNALRRGESLKIHNITTNMVSELLLKRVNNVGRLKSELKVPITEWPAVHAKPCPHFLREQSHRYERGLGIAHIQILMEFVFFDKDVIDAMNRPKKEFIISNSYSSTSGIFQSFENGTLLKNGITFQDKDIMLVFEDNIYPTVTNINSALTHSLSIMNSDFMQLSYCNDQFDSDLDSVSAVKERFFTPDFKDWPLTTDTSPLVIVPNFNAIIGKEKSICTFSYAVTREGANKIVDNFDFCGKSLGEQLYNMIKNEILTYEKAEVSGLIDEKNEKIEGEKMNMSGLFKQISGNSTSH